MYMILVYLYMNVYPRLSPSLSMYRKTVSVYSESKFFSTNP